MEAELAYIPALIVLGKVFKISKLIPDHMIPLTLIIISCLISFFISGLTASNFLKAVIYAGAATGLHQVAKQNEKKDYL